MSEPLQFGYQDDRTDGPMHPIPAPGLQGQYKFSPEELRAIKECNQESFYQRSLPLGTLFGFGTFTAIQAGYLKSNPRLGVFPKVTLAVMAGYFLGKLSYQQACAEKLMALPGSYIGQLLRDRRDGKITAGAPPKGPTMFGAGPADIYSDAGPGSSLDLDTDRPAFNDDTYRPDVEGGSVTQSEPSAAARPSLSYDELRRRNRGDYADTRQDPYKMEPNLVPPITRGRPAQPSVVDPDSKITKPPTNKYGDTME